CFCALVAKKSVFICLIRVIRVSITKNRNADNAGGTDFHRFVFCVSVAKKSVLISFICVIRVPISVSRWQNKNPFLSA
ncbi:MAG: hypothetical protein MUE72_14190, partial [Chitinophagaceae bacterium]|nr:hypothetical protein [Chitinophagaceae bacterium]